MKQYRKRPVVIEAIQYTPETRDECLAFSADILSHPDNDETLLIQTPKGTMAGQLGDWIIRGVAGEFSLCKPDIFEKTYDDCMTGPVTEVAVAKPDRQPDKTYDLA